MKDENSEICVEPNNIMRSLETNRSIEQSDLLSHEGNNASKIDVNIYSVFEDFEIREINEYLADETRSETFLELILISIGKNENIQDIFPQIGFICVINSAIKWHHTDLLSKLIKIIMKHSNDFLVLYLEEIFNIDLLMDLENDILIIFSKVLSKLLDINQEVIVLSLFERIDELVSYIFAMPQINVDACFILGKILDYCYSSKSLQLIIFKFYILILENHS